MIFFDKRKNIFGTSRNSFLVLRVYFQECDVILAVIRATPERLQLLEFVHPWMYSQVAFIIPMPEVSNNNVDAVIKPFQLWVRCLSKIQLLCL